MSGACHICESLGSLALLYIVYRLLDAVYFIFRPFIFGEAIANLKKFSGGDWAVITGATDGIGKAYASALAARGFNIALIGRNPEKLKAVASEIGTQHGSVEIKQIVFDFKNADVQTYKYDIGDKLQQLNIGVLVNNVGMSHEFANYFAELTDLHNTVRDVTVVNCVSALELTALVLPSMLTRRSGVIINVASGAGLGPLPTLATYAGSKAFLYTYTKSLQYEYRKSGVFIQVTTPYGVATKMTKVRNDKLPFPVNFFVPTPETYVKHALMTIGVQADTAGYLFHNIQRVVTMMFPLWLSNWLWLMVGLNVRKQGLKRLQREKENVGQGQDMGEPTGRGKDE